ncbi:HAD family hydrolase [Nanoarchaeota archaeon]
MPEIFLDLDDTLINTTPTIIKRLEILLKKYPVDEGLFYVHNLLVHPQRELILSNRYDFSKEFWREYEVLRAQIEPRSIGDIKGKLNSFRDHFKLGILSSSLRQKIERSLANIGLNERYFESGLYCRDNLTHPKPDVRCLEEIGSDRSIVYVGDDIQDYLFSKKAGIGFVAVCTGLTSRDTFLYLGQDESKIFPSIQEVTLDAVL